MNDVNDAEVIQFPKPQPKAKIVTKCAFCQKPLIKGKHVQSEETDPAICFDCIKVCSGLIGETK